MKQMRIFLVCLLLLGTFITPLVSENARGAVTINIRAWNFFTSSVHVRWSVDSQAYDHEFWSNPATSSPTITPKYTDSPTVNVSPGNHRYYFEYYHPQRSVWVDGGYYDGNFLDGSTRSIWVYLDGPNPPSSPDPANGASNLEPPTFLTWQETISNAKSNSYVDVLYFGTTNPPPYVGEFWSTADSFSGWRSGVWLSTFGIVPEYGTTYYWNIEEYSVFGKADMDPPRIPANVVGPTWSFTTVEDLQPYVTSTAPDDGETNVDKSAGTYVIQFSEPMMTTGTPLSNLPGVSWNWNGDQQFEGSYASLSDSTVYYVDLTGQGFQDLAGNTLTGDVYFEFTTGTDDIISPTITATNPSDGATGVSTSAGTYTIQFDEPMSAVGTPNSNLPGASWNWNGNQQMDGTYDPLSESTSYYVNLAGQGFQDLAGNPLAGDMYKQFTTQSTSDTIPPSTINNLATSNPTTNSLTLTWTAPGDDGAVGRATGYVVKFSTSGQITEGNWASATTYSQSWIPLSAGNPENHIVTGLSSGTTYWFAVKAFDEASNYGAVSDSPTGTTSYQPPEITQVTSLYKNFYVQGLDITNTFYATIQSGEPVLSVEFLLTGGESTTDTNGNDGWSASFDMGDVQVGDTLTVTATTASGLDKETVPLNVVSSPCWFEAWVSVSLMNFQVTTSFSSNNDWMIELEFSVPQSPVDLGLSVPSSIPVFGGGYGISFFFFVGTQVRSDATITLYGGGSFGAAVMGREAGFTAVISGTWQVVQNTIEWVSVSITVSGELAIPIFTQGVDFTLVEGVTVVRAYLEISIVPSASLTFTLEPSPNGFQIVPGIAISSIQGELSLGIRGEAELILLDVIVGSVSGGGSATLGFEPGGEWIDWFSVNAYFDVIFLGVEFGLSYTWFSDDPSTRGRGDESNVTWDVITKKGDCIPEVTDYSNSSVSVHLEGMEEEIDEVRPDTPEDASANQRTDGVKITWSPVEGAVGYYIYSVDSDGNLILVAFVASPSTSFFHNVDSDAAFTYVITAVNSQGLESNPSSELVPQSEDNPLLIPVLVSVVVLFVIAVVAFCIRRKTGRTRPYRRPLGEEGAEEESKETEKAPEEVEEEDSLGE